ncbi:MAG TPA: diphthine synthase [Candidatus Nanoarchaeia archaeon]|nr:diphthine synthase [Candidatus Nanoarchaeia archaeon]
MPLYFIGLGLNNEKDITINGLEAIRKSDLIYLENYTSVLNCDKPTLEKFYNKKIILANRKMVENDENEIIENSKTKNVAFLVVGDSLAATTHIDLYLRAKKERIKCFVIHNSSILTAIGVTGLQLYKFGKTTSIPLENENVETPYDVLKGNLRLGLHTLFLLDLNPEENKFMTINDTIRYLLKIELKRNEKIFSEKTLCVGCAMVGSENQLIKYGTGKELLKFDFGKPVHCLIIPGKLHFMEEEVLSTYKI